MGARVFRLSSLILVPLAAFPSHAVFAEAERCPFLSTGLIVESVEPESTGARAGLMPGDRLVSWCRSAGDGGGCATRGDFRTGFDWESLQRGDIQYGGF